MRAMVIAACLVTACAGEHTDAGTVDASILDAGARDADASNQCAPLSNFYCEDHGYGTPCSIPCSYPPDCTFTVTARFSNPCCVENDVGYGDCVCELGRAVCRFPGSTEPRTPPLSWCTQTCGDAGVPDL